MVENSLIFLNGEVGLVFLPFNLGGHVVAMNNTGLGMVLYLRPVH